MYLLEYQHTVVRIADVLTTSLERLSSWSSAQISLSTIPFHMEKALTPMREPNSIQYTTQDLLFDWNTTHSSKFSGEFEEMHKWATFYSLTLNSRSPQSLTNYASPRHSSTTKAHIGPFFHHAWSWYVCTQLTSLTMMHARGAGLRAPRKSPNRLVATTHRRFPSPSESLWQCVNYLLSFHSIPPPLKRFLMPRIRSRPTVLIPDHPSSSTNLCACEIATIDETNTLFHVSNSDNLVWVLSWRFWRKPMWITTDSSIFSV